MILTQSTHRVRRSVTRGMGIALVCLMGLSAYAGKSLVQDRRVTMAQAQAMAERAQLNSTFPVVVNDLVLKELNRYIGTPEGREYMRSALQRMENYRRTVEQTMQTYGAPSELMAVPITESGYQNLEDCHQKAWGAGLWMFIKSTARVYGLRVDSQVDERLNVEVLTDAAMRYLSANHLRFKDWHLALLAYNMGEEAVQTAIEKTGSRDAWVLIRRGYEGDPGYLPKVMAAILIMRNPDSVK